MRRAKGVASSFSKNARDHGWLKERRSMSSTAGRSSRRMSRSVTGQSCSRTATAPPSPANERRRPGEACAERGQTDERSRPDASGELRLVQGDRDGGRGGVPVAVDVVDDLLLGKLEPLRDQLACEMVRMVGCSQYEVG